MSDDPLHTTELQRAISDLGPAQRHLQRIRQGVLPPTPAVLDEIARSVERCVARLVVLDEQYETTQRPPRPQSLNEEGYR